MLFYIQRCDVSNRMVTETITDGIASVSYYESRRGQAERHVFLIIVLNYYSRHRIPEELVTRPDEVSRN